MKKRWPLLAILGQRLSLGKMQSYQQRQGVAMARQSP